MLAPSGKIYIGKHLFDNGIYQIRGYGKLPDGYTGSGTYIKYAHKKYGNLMKWRILAIVDDNKSNKAEQRAIKLTKYIFGKNCMNIKDGGDGFTSSDMKSNWENPEYAERNIASVRRALSKKSVRLKFKEAAHKRWSCPQYRAAHKKGLREAACRPEVKSQIKSANIARWKDPNARGNASKKAKEWWSDPAVKEKMSKINKAAQGNPEVRAKASIKQKEVQNDPEVKKRQVAGVNASWSDPQKKAERIAKCAATRAKNKAKK